jgi:hypothetical protein
VCKHTLRKYESVTKEARELCEQAHFTMISGRKVSATLTFDEVQKRQQNLRILFNKCRDGAPGVSAAQCMKFVGDNGLIDKRVKSSDVSLAFSGVKLGKRDTLDFERFEVRPCLDLPHSPTLEM